MSLSTGRVVIAVVCLLWLGGCETSTKLGDLLHAKSDTPDAVASADPGTANALAEPATTGSIGQAPTPPVTDADPRLLGTDPNDDLSLGKKQYRAGNFGLAERYFRRATETHPDRKSVV